MHTESKILSVSIVILLVSFIATVALLAQDAPKADPQQIEALFDKMKQARRTVSYRGEVRIERLFGRSVRAIHKRVYANPVHNQFREQLILQPEERERLTLERARQDTTSRYRRISRQWSPDFQRYISSEQNFADLSIRLDLLQQNYIITYDPDNVAVERPADFISIEPKYEFRPGRKLWIDKETGLILKSEIFIAQNPDSPVYREEFVTIEFIVPDTPPEQQEIRARPERTHRRPGYIRTNEYNSFDEAPRWSKSYIRIPTKIPDGFALDKLLITSERQKYTYHQVYTDGLIMFSLFQIEGELPEQFQEMKQRNQRRPGISFPLEESILTMKGSRYNFIIWGFAPGELLKPVLDSIPPPKRFPGKTAGLSAAGGFIKQ